MVTRRTRQGRATSRKLGSLQYKKEDHEPHEGDNREGASSDEFTYVGTETTESEDLRHEASRSH
jgi:hypothetical protein